MPADVLLKKVIELNELGLIQNWAWILKFKYSGHFGLGPFGSLHLWTKNVTNVLKAI